MKFQYNPPLIIKKLFKDFLWQTSNSKILLTFDDGPNQNITEKILSVLNRLKIKALFFCIGDNIKRNNELVHQILDEGHSMGNHTYYHNVLISLNRREALEEIKSVNELMKNDFDYELKYFRPPYGRE